MKRARLYIGRFVLPSLTQSFSILLLVFSLFLVTSSSTYALQNCDEFSCNKDEQSEDKYFECNKKKQSCLEDNIKAAQSAAITLSNTISIINGQISLQALQIDQTLAEIAKLDREIEELSGRIAGLDLSLDRLSSVLINRINEQYKTNRSHPKVLLLVSDSVGNFLTNYKYLQLTQAQTADAMQRAEVQKTEFDTQKALKEDKQQQVEAKRLFLEQQRADLASKKNAQQQLLTETKSNESRFQAELAKTRAELEAIQAIIAGKGDETKVDEVKEGDTIASVIQGSSCNSSGAHLHFIVSDDGVVKNPFNYLKDGIDYTNCSGASCGNGGDPFNPTGSWNWPMRPSIRFFQGYGETWAVKNSWVSRIYRFHNGIDIVSTSSMSVKAVKEGTLYRGSYSGSGGCRLRYVRVEHKDSDISTFYLHVNY